MRHVGTVIIIQVDLVLSLLCYRHDRHAVYHSYADLRPNMAYFYREPETRWSHKSLRAAQLGL